MITTDLSLRDYFAAKAMQAIVNGMAQAEYDRTDEELTSRAYQIADEMLRVRQLRNSKPHAELTDVSNMTLEDVVPYYVDLIRQSSGRGTSKEITRINNLIINKWTPEGLTYVKDRAWGQR